MVDTTSISAEQGTLDALEARVDDLVQRCVHLQNEVVTLRRREQDWDTERAHLLERHAMAKARVEAIVSRLKSLERP
jgi:cell division protein ZapB